MLSVKEAIAVGRLLDFLLQTANRDDDQVGGREAMEAAMELAGSANRRLMSGLKPMQWHSFSAGKGTRS